MYRNRRFYGEVKASIEPTGIMFGHISKWSDDIDKKVPLWQDVRWKGILKLGYGTFYTKSGDVWFEGTMEEHVAE